MNRIKRNFFISQKLSILTKIIIMQKIYLFLALMMASIFGAQAGEKKVYTSYNSSTKTLTYYYDDQYGSRAQVEYYPVNTRWVDYSEQVIYGKVDASMKNAPLTSMRNLFLGFNGTTGSYCYLSNMLSITGLDNLNTAIVTNMKSMFEGCSSLTELNLSSFNTSNVTSMNNMFNGCSSLTKLNLSSFNTTNVTNMRLMFKNCLSLASLDLSNFNTAKVTSMYSMFDACHALQSLEVSSFNTSNVTEMSYMFCGCNQLEEINVDNFDVSKADISYIFTGCQALKTIYCSHDWSSKTGTDMFLQCFKLVGGNGTAYSSDKRMDAYFARPDGLNGKPGYFTKMPKVYTVFDGVDKLTYYYNDDYDLTNKNHELFTPGGLHWSTCHDKVKTVIVDASMQNAPLTSMINMFYGGFNGMKYYTLTNMTSIIGLDYLNTKNVTDMTYMFFGCESLTELDLSSFNTENVEWMYEMFYNCKSLTELNLNSFKTDKVEWMFEMFFNCSALTTIYCNEDWSKNTSMDSEDMFKGCTALVGGNGTAYKSTNVDATYARPDDPDNDQPGYFSKKEPTAIESIQPSAVSCQKILRDGQILILRGDKVYTITGQEVR